MKMFPRFDEVRPLEFRSAIAAVCRCMARTLRLLVRRDLHQPGDRVGQTIRFADGSAGVVYRETAVDGAVAAPVVVIVGFRLRHVRRQWAHAAFRAESVLNTMLFAGFPGFVSKLWLRHDDNGRYRGVYQWDGVSRAHAYVSALWWVLAAVSEPDSIRAVVLPGLDRDVVLAHPGLVDEVMPTGGGEWWRPGAAALQVVARPV